jgi:hypothetical protein
MINMDSIKNQSWTQVLTKDRQVLSLIGQSPYYSYIEDVLDTTLRNSNKHSMITVLLLRATRNSPSYSFVSMPLLLILQQLVSLFASWYSNVILCLFA